ncbi:MAG: DnaB-like helicase N-terminal domain-containing protein [Rickettsiales bacterium]
MKAFEKTEDFIYSPIECVESEQALLGAVISNSRLLDAIPADLSENHFYEPLHSEIFREIKDFQNTEKAWDLLTISQHLSKDERLEKLGGARGYLLKLYQFSVMPVSVPALARQIIDYANRRKIVDICRLAMIKAGQTEYESTASEIAADAYGELENLSVSNRFKVSTSKEVSRKIIDEIKQNRGVDRDITGISKLDVSLDGGLFTGKLYGIVGRKKTGKTMLAGTISHNLQEMGTRHMYLALEMGSKEIHQRSLARSAGCKEAVFRLGVNDSLLLKMEQFAENENTAKLYLDAPSLTFTDLRQLLPLYIKKHKIKGFILDCWQLVGGKRKGLSTAEHLDELAQWLAEVVKKYGVWGLVTAQENQDGNTRGGEGLRLACDQLYRLTKAETDSPYAWLEMMETRYTRWQDVGSENNPALRIADGGTHYEQTGIIV